MRDLVRSRGLGDVYKRQARNLPVRRLETDHAAIRRRPDHRAVGLRTDRQRHHAGGHRGCRTTGGAAWSCLLYTSDAADERSSVDLGGRRIIKKKKHEHVERYLQHKQVSRTPAT